MNTGKTRFLKLAAAGVLLSAQTTWAQNFDNWRYHREWDRLSNSEYSLARSPLPKRNLYDLIRLELVCKNNRLQLIVDSNSLITSQNRAFDFEYQIDDNPSVTIQMRTFPDSKRLAYSDEHAQEIAEAILSGNTIFVRIHTLIKKVLSGAMPLDDAAEPIVRVLADCGIEAAGRHGETPDYSRSEFERDFGELNPEQQQRVLNQIRRIIEDIRQR